MLPRAAVLAVLALALTAAPAGAAKMVVKGAPAPGPAKYDRVTVWTYGPASADTVLVLVPGTSGGAGSVALVAKDLATRVKGLQVWALDRREEAFEDQSVFRDGTLAEIEDYYLGGKYDKPPEDVSFVGDWGLAVQSGDLRRVIRKARDGGRRQVVLGGHSRGASQVAAYAAWDFGGRPGFRDLAGLVLIDGGLLGFLNERDSQPYTRKSARDAIRDAREQPFNDAIGLGIPAIAQIVGQAMGTFAARAPNAASALQDSPLLEAYAPDFRVTNEALLGYLFDKTYSPPSFRALQIHGGELEESGEPRGWHSGEHTPVARYAAAFGGSDPDFTEWYYPQRLVVDIGAANPMRRDAASKALGLRLFHTAKIDTPLYAFETDLLPDRVLAGARRLIERSKITRKRLVRDHDMSHLDPVAARPSANTFTRTVVPFLRDIVKSGAAR